MTASRHNRRASIRADAQLLLGLADAGGNNDNPRASAALSTIAPAGVM